MKTSRTLRTFVGTCALALAFAPAALAQDTQTTNTHAASVASGQKTKLRGAVVSSTGNSFVIQDDASGAQTTVVVNDRTSIKTKGGFFGGGTKYAAANVTRGLHVEVEGRGDGTNLVAEKVRFTDTDLPANYSAVESAGTATVTVTRIGSTSSQATVQFATVAGGTAVAGQDYTTTTGTLTFGAGVTSRTFTVPVKDNTVVDGSRTALVPV